MASLNRQPQGHLLGTSAEGSTILQFSQYKGDFTLSGDLIYVLSALSGAIFLAMSAQHYKLSDGMTVLAVLLWGVAAVALRIRIFNRYAFVMKQVTVSRDGDLEWFGQWVPNAGIHQIQLRPDTQQRGCSQVVCVTSTGERHVVGILPHIRAEAICRDLRRALGYSCDPVPLPVVTAATPVQGA